MSFTDVFGGDLIFPSQLSYLSITTAVDVTLQWPTEQQITDGNVVADVMDVDTTVPSLNIDMPSASITSTGNKATFNNRGSNSFTVRDNTGGTIQQVLSGEQWVVVLTDNTTVAGLWSTFQLGGNAATAASASALAGAGLKAIGPLLNQKIDSDVKNSTPITVVTGDRAKCLIYTAGAGVANLPSAGGVGNDWFFMLRNSGSGTLTIMPAAGTIDGSANIALDVNSSAIIFTDGTDWFTVGLTASSTIAFDFISLPIPGSGDFVLSGANLNRIAYRFTGALTGNRKVVVPDTTQQYWCDNQTTGAFVLTIGTNAQVSPPTLDAAQTAILYSNSIEVLDAVNAVSVMFPISVAQGGTGVSAVEDWPFVKDLNVAVPVAGDFLAFQDIDDSDRNRKATIADIGALVSLTVEDEGTPLATLADTLDFVGAGVVASGVGATKTITIPGGVSGITIEDEGVPLATIADTLDFVGAGVVASGVGGTKTITIAGAGGGVNNPMTVDLDGDGFDLDDMGVLFMREQAAQNPPIGSQGQLWVRNDSPNTLIFTDDVGTDFPLGGISSGSVVVTTGTFSPGWTGFSVNPTATMRWTKYSPNLAGADAIVVLHPIGTSTGTSNATGMTMTGLPADITPTSFGTTFTALASMTDSGVVNLDGAFSVNTVNVMTFGLGTVSGSNVGNDFAGFTAAGVKGFANNTLMIYGLVE